MTHHLLRVYFYEKAGDIATADLVQHLGTNCDIARDLAYRLFDVSEKKKRSQEALAYNTQVVATAAGDAARFTGLASEYAKAPRETGTRLYLETMDEVLPKIDKTIIGKSKAVDLQFVRK